MTEHLDSHAAGEGLTDEEMMNTALEMAMQNYPRWAGK